MMKSDIEIASKCDCPDQQWRTDIKRALDRANIRPWSSENRTGHLELHRPTGDHKYHSYHKKDSSKNCQALSNEIITIFCLVCRQR